MLGAATAPTLAADTAAPVLVPEVSQHAIHVEQGFTGADLLLYGAILTPEGRAVARDYDIVVVVEGPPRAVVVREKQKVAGVWVNAVSSRFRSAPGFFAVASSRPVAAIVDARTASIYELGLDWLQLSPIGSIDPAQQQHFARGLVAHMQHMGLYHEDSGAVTISHQVLYQARIALPSSVPTGDYTAETFAIRQGRVLASGITRIRVEKQGFARFIADRAAHAGLAYGLCAVLLSVTMGWIAGRLFSRV
ncbi:TIGR02186 family protein [Novosphingobium sp.]|uniref:TIGR02186 family protein n=1 Tax=Novosphingobium sp. TaxID=1874826 RepID=UPI003340DE55